MCKQYDKRAYEKRNWKKIKIYNQAIEILDLSAYLSGPGVCGRVIRLLRVSRFLGAQVPDFLFDGALFIVRRQTSTQETRISKQKRCSALVQLISCKPCECEQLLK